MEAIWPCACGSKIVFPIVHFLFSHRLHQYPDARSLTRRSEEAPSNEKSIENRNCRILIWKIMALALMRYAVPRKFAIDARTLQGRNGPKPGPHESGWSDGWLSLSLPAAACHGDTSEGVNTRSAPRRRAAGLADSQRSRCCPRPKKQICGNTNFKI